jgi:hypothetical protein
MKTNQFQCRYHFPRDIRTSHLFLRTGICPRGRSPAEGMLAAEVLAQQCVILVEQPHISRQVNWARLIQKIYEVDPLTCPKCQGKMRIVYLLFSDSQECFNLILLY